MEVINRRSALLSNFEVLTLLRELESDHLAKTRTALRIKKEEEAAGASSGPRSQPAQDDISENLRTVEVEAIRYLSAEYQPTASQTDAGIAQLTRSLSTYDLTKAEKLQIVNLAPTEPVELYVIVEELEDRLGDRIDDVLEVVRSSLTSPVPAAPPVDLTNEASAPTGHDPHPNEPSAYEDFQTDDVVFDDTGEGQGIEGDLDVEED